MHTQRETQVNKNKTQEKSFKTERVWGEKTGQEDHCSN